METALVSVARGRRLLRAGDTNLNLSAMNTDKTDVTRTTDLALPTAEKQPTAVGINGMTYWVRCLRTQRTICLNSTFTRPFVKFRSV